MPQQALLLQVLQPTSAKDDMRSNISNLYVNLHLLPPLFMSRATTDTLPAISISIPIERWKFLIESSNSPSEAYSFHQPLLMSPFPLQNPVFNPFWSLIKTVLTPSKISSPQFCKMNIYLCSIYLCLDDTSRKWTMNLNEWMILLVEKRANYFTLHQAIQFRILFWLDAYVSMVSWEFRW